MSPKKHLKGVVKKEHPQQMKFDFRKPEQTVRSSGFELTTCKSMVKTKDGAV